MRKQSPRQRFQEIVGVFAKYGKEGITSPVKLRQALEELGPTFIKIGQILSTRPDILSQQYIDEFQRLQDDVRPTDFSVIRRTIEAELGGPLEELFLDIDSQPMASASIAQVHRATLPDGSQVVVKVKHPGIDEKIFNDLKLLKQMARITKIIPQTSVWNPGEVVDELKQSLAAELDFLREAENIRQFKANHAGIKYVTIPQLYRDLVTSNVLVMGYIQGIKISDRTALEQAGYDLEEIATKLAYNFMYQIFEQGLFHADLHPGNILISANKIAYLDFGLVGKINQRLQRNFNRLLMGIVQGDLDLILNSVIHIGVKKGQLDRSKLRGEIEHLYNEYSTASIYDIDIPDLMEQTFRICRQNKIAFPRDIALLIKGIVVLEGNISRLAPSLAIMELMAPYIRAQILRTHDPRQEALNYATRLYRLTRSSLRIPDKVLEILNSVSAGTAKIQMEHINLKDFIMDLKKSVNRLVFALIVSALIIGSSLIVTTEAGPKIFSISILGLVGYMGAGIMGLWLLISILRSGKI